MQWKYYGEVGQEIGYHSLGRKELERIIDLNFIEGEEIFLSPTITRPSFEQEFVFLIVQNIP